MNVGCDSGFETITYTLLFCSLVDRVASFPGLPHRPVFDRLQWPKTHPSLKSIVTPQSSREPTIFLMVRGARGGKKTLLPCTRGWETWTVGRPWNEAIDRVYAVVLGGGGGGGVT